ncbi:MAG: hypothetical protein ABIH21_02835 [Patescibacteria group bacterium]
MRKEKNNHCRDCDLPQWNHFQTWSDEIIGRLIPDVALPRKVEKAFDYLIERFFVLLGLVRVDEDFSISDIQLRTHCFIKEAKKRGVKFQALKSKFGYTNYYRAVFENKVYRFEGLPSAIFTGRFSPQLVDDKEKTKEHLVQGNFPIAKGGCFWFWQKNRAVKHCEKHIGFPLIVKPRSGSVSRHVTTNIQSSEQLLSAIKHAIVYSPAYIVEEFLPDTFVYRLTVVDFENVFCVKQVPANVVGDGTSTIAQLINKKNNDSCRSCEGDVALQHKLVINEKTNELLAQQNCDFDSVPQQGNIVWLQKDSFLALGGDLHEMTALAHPDNILLAKEIARHFDIRLVGIDLLCEDITCSWKEQRGAVLELNNNPCIELHHFPSIGEPQNVASKLVDLFFKYYVDIN